MCQKIITKPVPTSNNLAGTYESLWGACVNKVIASIASKNKSYIFHAARDAQGNLNEIASNIGTRRYDVMQFFDVDNPEIFLEEFLKVVDEYAMECEKSGCKIARFDDFEELYNYCMGIK